MRDFIENHLLEFVHRNPGIVIYLQPRRHHSPLLFAEYLNGKSVHLSVGNYTSNELCQWIEHLRCRSGDELIRLRKTWHTETPSVQGIWTPFTNLDPQLAVTTLPDDKLSACPASLSATEHLTKLAEQLKISPVASSTLANCKPN
jgi:large subunit ribosomal protein L43